MYVPPEGGLPIFPLPRVVLLPGELLPLHVFEPRYRAMVASAMAGDRLLGMATLRASEDAGGAPPVHTELGVGRIVRHQPLPEGRSNLLVRFVAATHIEAELETAEPFRRVLARLLPEVAPETYRGAGSLKVLAAQALGRSGLVSVETELFDLPPPAFVDAAARLFLDDPDDRRAYLVAASGEERVALVQAALLGALGDGGAIAET